MKKKAQNFTIMLVPHSGSSCLSINTPLFFIKLISGLIIASIIFAAIYNTIYLVSYTHLKKEAEKLSIKMEEYRELEKRVDYYVVKTQNYMEKIMDIQTLDTNIRDMLKDDPNYKFTVKKEKDIQVR